MLGRCNAAAANLRGLLNTFAAPLATGLTIGALEVAANFVILDVSGAAGPALLAALGNLLAGLRFGQTLLPGREPLISRFSRYDTAGVPDHDGCYTRLLTMMWGSVLLAFALAFLLAAGGYCSTVVLSQLEPVALIALFLGEHAVRRRRFPNLSRVTPSSTIRAILLSYRQAPHAP
jgi:uncharacterized membrane protein